MSFHSQVANQLDTYSLECACCEGSGVIVSVMRVVGESFDADLSETRCTACNGKCEFQLCGQCDGDVVDGHCGPCEVAL